MTTNTKLWRIIDLINWGTNHFTAKGLNNARREMEWFLCEILACKRIDLYVRFEEIMSGSEMKVFRKMVKRRNMSGLCWDVGKQLVRTIDETT